MGAWNPSGLETLPGRNWWAKSLCREMTLWLTRIALFHVKGKIRDEGATDWKLLRSGLERGIAGLPSSRIHVWVFERKSKRKVKVNGWEESAKEKENGDKDPALTNVDGQFRFSTLLSQDYHLRNFYLSIHLFIHLCIHSCMYASMHCSVNQF